MLSEFSKNASYVVVNQREVVSYEVQFKHNVLRTRFKNKILPPLTFGDFSTKPFVCTKKSKRKRKELLMHDVELNPGPVVWQTSSVVYKPIIDSMRNTLDLVSKSADDAGLKDLVDYYRQNAQESWSIVKPYFGYSEKFGFIGTWLAFHLDVETLHYLEAMRVQVIQYYGEEQA